MFINKRHLNHVRPPLHSNYIESVTQQWRKSAPPILSTSHCEFYGTRLCTHARKPSPWHLFIHLLTNSTFNVSRIVDLKSLDIHGTSIPHAPYKLPSIKNIFLLLSFSSYTFFMGFQELA